MSMNLLDTTLDDTQSISCFILASSSPRRKELVAALDLSLPVSVFSVETDEAIDPKWSAKEAVERLSIQKAKAVEEAIHRGACPTELMHSSALILAADTVVVLDGKILGKPDSEADAVLTLTKLQGRSHQVYTGVTLMNSSTGQMLTSSRSTEVNMLPLSKTMIERYVATGEPMDKAGSYGIQGKGALFIDRIDGCYFNVVGLPISLVAGMLQQWNISVL